MLFRSQNTVDGNALEEVGYLNLIDEGSVWSANYIDPNVLIDTNLGGVTGTYPRVRSIGAVTGNILPFMSNTLASSFGVIFFFNSHNKTYDTMNLDL